MSRRKPLARLITQHLSKDQLQTNANKLAGLLAENSLNVAHVAQATGAQSRAVRRWVRLALDKGIDVLELARVELRAKGVDPESFPAERVRVGMVDARDRPVPEDPPPPKRGPGRPRKILQAIKESPKRGPEKEKNKPIISTN